MDILYYNITFSLKSALFFSINPSNLYLPKNNTHNQYTNRSIQCYVVNGITEPSKYTFQIDTVSSFDSAVLETSSGTNYISSSNVIRKANQNLFLMPMIQANGLRFGILKQLVMPVSIIKILANCL